MLGNALPITVWSSAESISTNEMPIIASKACLRLRGGWAATVIAEACESVVSVEFVTCSYGCGKRPVSPGGRNDEY